MSSLALSMIYIASNMLKPPAKVGNDVWIADDVIVHAGVTIRWYILGDNITYCGQV